MNKDQLTDELTLHLTTLKRNLRESIQNAVTQFHKDTGLTPSSIDVHMVDTTAANDAFAQFSVASVWVGFKL